MMIFLGDEEVGVKISVKKKKDRYTKCTAVLPESYGSN